VKVDPSFDAYVRQRAAGLLRLAYLLTGDRGHAEDLLQNALRRVLVNLSRDRLRARSRRPPEAPLPVDDGALPTVDAGLDRVGQHGMVTSALAALPDRQRQAIVLRYYADLSVEETAAVMRCSAGAVKSHTSRAVARLREVLGPQLLTEVHHAG
jgi:DNA-directed RNA polymerase specialized sigma24 family protein